jgi:thiol-disulfide isomerase/thioredoxin
MIERIVFLILFAGFSALAYGLLRRWQVRRAARFAPGDPLLATLRPGVPAILYFTTPFCGPCITQQRPALQRLRDLLGDGVQVIEVDAMAQQDAADRWGVLSVPTTFILDGQGRPRQINHGVAGVDKLMQQVQRL